MSDFLICGLPRSRTLWMAEFMTDRNSICAHEPMFRMNTVEDIKEFYDKGNQIFKGNIGISDSGAGFFIDWILENVKPRTLIIHRDHLEVEESLKGMGLGYVKTDFCKVLQSKYDAVKGHPLVLNVSFDALKDMRVMQHCFWHLLPNETFDEGRFKQMTNQIMEVDPRQKLNDFVANKGKLFDCINEQITVLE